MKKVITNWGNFPVINSNEINFTNESDLLDSLDSNDKFIARGLGRCYGDASLSGNTISTLKYDKVLYFNQEEGIIECQSGVSFSDILNIVIPKGWFLPVTPGTKYITVGGAVASDVHGKNHHVEASFSNHIIHLEILLANGTKLVCSETQNSDLFQATCGGMGLTGIILSVRFKLKKIETSFITQKQIKAKNLKEILSLFNEYKDYTYSMAWIDCLKKGKQFGRSILIVGEHTKQEEIKNSAPLKADFKPKYSVPFNLPNFTLNNYSVRLFNFFYYHKNFKRIIESVVPYEPFFYPLDSILNWNRIYGKKGFVQYQFVLPLENSEEGLTKILGEINKNGMGSFLAVLKLFGKQDSLISFPMEGYTLALDFPIKKGLFEFLHKLDSIVADYRGRIYLSKDARMKSGFFLDSYPNIDSFVEIVEKYNPELRFTSLQSERLLTPKFADRVLH